ncbi:MAG TPA: hypothetical protein VK779_08605 [Rhizomicrobium sp.]|jgi:protein ImuA|nr:hypothetical protein [Rhizomicrobium sp.]
MRTERVHLKALRGLVQPSLAGDDAGVRVPLGHAETDARLGGGLLRGTLHEVYAGDASAATGFAAALAIRTMDDRDMLWVRQDFSALEHGEMSATGFLELGLNPSRLILMRAAHAEDALRAGADALSCAGLGAVVIEIPGTPKILDLTASRRLVLAASRKRVTVFLLRFGARPQASAAETRWIVRAAPSHFDDEDWGAPRFDAELSRNRHGSTGHWIMEWSAEDGCFRKTDFGALAAAFADGSAATEFREAV